ncbi:uncharacterized protein LOC131524077 [Onychostoma macrolepis]|uniref:uncharacterized protein LOC131524077 n=1 Tax=Onychostoma macrolepis TaxID=369639 RepID=UPI00272CD5EF|nr:uncharacterized protein LOC131524077 [Onychostoma macrolepis]
MLLRSGLGRSSLSDFPPLDGKVHPCAYFSHRLSPAERNYDVGNRELLAVRLALGEWRHWLEGAAEPFLVWTDHKNLEYIRSAKRLNSRQARWALFFDRFRFTLSYRPGSKNIKPDALSRLFASPGSGRRPTPFCPGVSWWRPFPGVLRGGSGRPCGGWKFREAALLVCCLFQVHCVHQSLSGVILLGWSAIQGCGGRWLLPASAFGGLHCPMMSDSLWLLARFAPRTRLLTSLPLVCCGLCRSPPALGPILPWTLSLASPLPGAIP